MCAILTLLSIWVKWHMIFLYHSYILSYNYKICQNKKIIKDSILEESNTIFLISPLAVSICYFVFSFKPISHTAPRAS